MTHSFREVTFNYLGLIAKNLSQKVAPKVRVNSLTAAIKLLEVGNYPSLLLAEIYLLPRIKNILTFAKENSQVQKLMTFF